MKQVTIYKLFFIQFLILLGASDFTHSQQWEVVPSPNPSTVRNYLNGVYSVSTNDVWAVGSYDQDPSFTLIQHWNGVNWTTISSPNANFRYNVLEAVNGWSSNNVYAVGYTVGIPSTPQMMVLHWDGTSWTTQTTPTVQGGSSLQSIVIIGPDDIYAGGHRAGDGSPLGPTTGTLVTHWNGSSWNIEATPNPHTRHNEITDMKAVSPNDIWAVGYSRSIGVGPGFYYQAMVLHKTGSGWSIVPVPQSIEDENFLYSLDIIAPDNIWASGITNHEGQYQTLFFHYNGSTWTEVTSPQGGYGFVHGSASDIWSTGSGFVHYDGSTWSNVSAPIPYGGAMSSMSRLSSTEIWAVGRTADGSNLKTLTMHYGPGEGLTPVELASFEAAIDKNNVTLKWISATETNNKGFEIERSEATSVNGMTDWSKIGFVHGSGTTTERKEYYFVDKKVENGRYNYRLKQIDNDGTNKYSNAIDVDVTSPEEFSLGQNYPNPFNPSTTINYSLPEPGRITLKLYNMLGDEIAVLEDGVKERGNYSIGFNASDLASGVYFYTLKTAGFSETKKMLLMR